MNFATRLFGTLTGWRCVAVCGALLMLAAAGGETWAGQPPATRPADAAKLYLEAAQAIVAECPRESVLEYPDYPPFGADWERLAAAAWEENGKARQLARQARSIDQANWVAGGIGELKLCRQLANELSDAALYQHTQGRDAEAIESIRDVLHLAEMLRRHVPAEDAVRLLVATGIDALAMNDVLVIAPGLKWAKKPDDRTAVQVADARRFIAELLDQDSPEQMFNRAFGDKWKAVAGEEANTVRVMTERFNRANADRTMAAMSLACQMFRIDKGRWPNNLEGIAPAYIPRIPVDPWGSGKETFGYVLIKGGLPGGADRPLVFRRCESRDGLYYRTDAPQYGFYVGDGTLKASSQQKKGGQFRDVARWAPKGGRREYSAPRRLRDHAGAAIPEDSRLAGVGHPFRDF